MPSISMCAPELTPGAPAPRRLPPLSSSLLSSLHLPAPALRHAPGALLPFLASRLDRPLPPSLNLLSSSPSRIDLPLPSPSSFRSHPPLRAPLAPHPWTLNSSPHLLIPPSPTHHASPHPIISNSTRRHKRYFYHFKRRLDTSAGRGVTGLLSPFPYHLSASRAKNSATRRLPQPPTHDLHHQFTPLHHRLTTLTPRPIHAHEAHDRP